MSTLRLFGAAAVLFAVNAPAMAQEVIYEPGYCAQYYPDANCQNNGRNNPESPEYRRRIGHDGMMPSGDKTIGTAGKRTHAHRSHSSSVGKQ